MFNRIITVVEMFSSGYISSTYISCRPSSISRFSRCTLQKPGGNKILFKSTLVRLPQNTLCREVPLLWLAIFDTYICIFDICHNQTSNGFFPNHLLVLLCSREETSADPHFSLIPLSYRDYYLVVSDRQATHRLMIWAQNSFN